MGGGAKTAAASLVFRFTGRALLLTHCSAHISAHSAHALTIIRIGHHHATGGTHTTPDHAPLCTRHQHSATLASGPVSDYPDSLNGTAVPCWCSAVDPSSSSFHRRRLCATDDQQLMTPLRATLSEGRHGLSAPATSGHVHAPPDCTHPSNHHVHPDDADGQMQDKCTAQ